MNSMSQEYKFPADFQLHGSFTPLLPLQPHFCSAMPLLSTADVLAGWELITCYTECERDAQYSYAILFRMAVVWLSYVPDMHIVYSHCATYHPCQHHGGDASCSLSFSSGVPSASSLHPLHPPPRVGPLWTGVDSKRTLWYFDYAGRWVNNVKHIVHSLLASIH